MNPLRVLVVDDEPLARARLHTLLGDCTAPQALMVGEAADAAQTLDALTHLQCDLVLLDIHMPGVDGLALAEALRTMRPAPAVVFVTAHAEHAVRAFELEALDYLTKPVRLERLQQALHKVARQAGAGLASAVASTSAQRLHHVHAPLARPVPSVSTEFLVIQERSRTERVPLSDVLYFKAEQKYVTVRTTQRSYLLDVALNDLEAKYADHFLRIHRNALVARRSMRALEKHHDAEEGEVWTLRLDGLSERLVVSRRQLSAVRELLART